MSQFKTSELWLVALILCILVAWGVHLSNAARACWKRGPEYELVRGAVGLKCVRTA